MKNNDHKSRNRQKFIEQGGQDGRFRTKVVKDKKKEERLKRKNYEKNIND